MACPVCLHNFRDPRLLPCLHSVCRSCIDQLFVTAGGEQEIRCPVCRASCRLPDCGAAALPRDAMNTANQNKCGACSRGNPSNNTQVAARCTSCDIVLCKDHITPHIMSATNVHHLLDTIGTPSSEKPTEERPSSLTNRLQKKCTFKLCSEHAQVLMYHCTQCDVFVCGDCATVGKHANHKPIIHATQLARKTKEKADAQIQKLSVDVKPRLEEALHAVDHVTTQLTTNADQVRESIRSATQRAVHTVQACGEQLLQQVDDIETARHKVLEEQRENLNTHLNAINNVFQFNTRLQQHQNLEEQIELLEALKCRAVGLAETEVDTQPCRHANMQFIPPTDDILMAKRAIGTLMPCQGSASHCTFKQPPAIARAEEEAVFVLQSADSNGHRLTTGADHIITHWSKTPRKAPCPVAIVKDKKDGTYEVRLKVFVLGEYELQMKVNGENIPRPISFACINQLFDENKCGRNISLSENRRTATKLQGNFYVGAYNTHGTPDPVLGTVGMQHGRHTWQIRVTPSTSDDWATVGIASESPNQYGNYDSSPPFCKSGGYAFATDDAQSFCTSVGRTFTTDGAQSFCTSGGYTLTTKGAQSTSTMDAVQHGDTLHHVLDCDEHTLQVTNLRSQQSVTITNLPAKKFFICVNIRGNGCSMELL